MQKYIQLLDIELHNFLSFKDQKHTFKQGRNLVMGLNLTDSTSESNGSGKSSLIEGISFAFYKKTTKERDASFQFAGECFVKLRFKLNDKTYRIERYLREKTHGSSVYVYEDDIQVSMRKNQTTDDFIENLVGMSYEIFVMCVTVLQGLPVNFGNMTPVVRKSTVEDMLGFSWYETVRPEVQASIKSQTMALDEIKSQYQSTFNSMTALNARIETLNKVKEEDSAIKDKQIEDLKTEIADIAGKITLNNEEMKKKWGDKTTTDLYNLMTALNNKKITLTNRKSVLESIVQNVICPTCGQNYPHDKIEEAKQELDSITPMISKTSALHDEKNKERLELYNFEERIMLLKNSLMERKKSISGILNSENVQLSNSDVLSSELNDLMEKVNNLKEDVRFREEQLELTKYIDGLLLPSSRFRLHVLERYITIINSTLNSILPMMAANLSLRLDVDKKGNGIDLYIQQNYVDTTYKSLSGGERRRLDVALILSFQRFLLEVSGTVFNLLAFDEIFDSLDAKGVENTLNVIEILFPDVDSFYVITHNNAVKSLFTSVIKVVKTDGVSTIEGEVNAA